MIIGNVKIPILRDVEIDDENFLEEVFFDVRSDEFSIMGLPLEHLKALMKMQHAAQKQSYKWSFPDSEHLLIELNSEKIGRLWIKRYEDKIHLIDISILRDFRGKGIGSFLLDQLKSETETIILRVQKTNFGAIELYRRHDFVIAGDNETYWEMEWKNAG